MAVVTTGEELFVNAAWTTAKKVPATSPFGVPLTLGENAFATLDEAIAYAEDHSLTMVKFIDGDKAVAVSDAEGKVTYISSKEIKGTESVKGTTYTGQSKQTVANKIALDNSQAAETTVAGFKEVTLNGGIAQFTVLGGANTVTHVNAVTATAKGSTLKDSGTVAGKADGTLTVNGATLLTATGAWAEVQSENGAEITLDTEAFKAVYPGDPASIDWDVYGESVLPDLPGYATVTLAGGASAAVLLGGTLDFTHATDAVYTVSGESDYLSSLNKTLKYALKNSGKLTVTDASVGEARGYATVAVSGESADFDELNSDAFATTIKTTYKDTRSAKNTTVKTTQEATSTESANGTLTVESIGFGDALDRDVTGFSKVTVKNARLGMVRATGGKYTGNETRETVTTPIAGGSSVKVTETGSYSESDTATGSLATAKGNTSASFKSIMGYSKVELVNATVEQDIRIAGGGRPGSYSSSITTTKIGEKLMQSKTVNKEDYAAAGTVTMSGGSVGWRIEGAATVKLTGTTVSGGIIDGGTWKENYSEELSINSKTNALTSSYSSSTANQLKGTVTMTGGAVTGSDGIMDGIIGYQTVTLDGAAVAEDINDYDAYRTTFSAYKNEYSDSGVTLTKYTYSSGYSYAPATVLTLKNGATVGGDVCGVKTLNLSSGAAVAGEADMWNAKVQETDTISSKGGIYTETSQNSTVRGAAGTVTATGATVGDLWGAGKVTATDAMLGSICAVSSAFAFKQTLTGSAVGNYDDEYFISGAALSENVSSSIAFNAAGNATLTRTTAAKLEGVATVKLTEGAVEGAGAYNSKYVTSNVSSATASNAVSSNTLNTVGNFTATSAAVTGDIRGYSTVTLDQTKVTGGVGGWSYAEYRYGSNNVSSSLKQTFSKDGATLLTQNFASANSYAPTVALTLKNAAFVAGDAYGIKTLNIGGGATVGGNVYMANYGMKATGTITSDKKTGLYEQKRQYTSSQGAVGNATLTGISGGTDQLCGNISGAAKVTATDAVIGDLTQYCIVQSDSATRKGAALAEYDGSRYITAPTEYTSTYGYAVNASGNATLTRTSAGRIVNFATVKVTGGEIAGALVNSYDSSIATTLKGGVYTFSQTVSSGVQGTFTATDAVINGNVNRFATVNLTNCFLTDADSVIQGGSSIETMNGSGATIDAAIANASANKTSTFAAAGTLTAKTTSGGCVVENYATVNLTDCALNGVTVDDGNTAKTTLTLAGNNYIDDDIDDPDAYLVAGYANVTVKSGFTIVGGSFSGTAGNDTVTVNAKSELAFEGAMDFGTGTDSFTVNGTARIGGDFDAANLEKLSGSGLLALNDISAAALRASIDAGTTTLSGKLEIVAAGFEPDDVLAVRTKKEELADNTAATARDLEGIEMNGWLSGVEDAAAYKFADTEDWFNFSVVGDEAFQVEMTDGTRHGDLAVELWQGGAKVQDIAWNDMTERFDIAGLAAGDYQLKLSVAEETSALSYVFGLKQLA